jgi:hypothetical protein
MINQINITTINLLRKKIPQFSTIFTQSISSGVIKYNTKSKEEVINNQRKLKTWRTTIGIPIKPLINLSPDFPLFRLLQTNIDFSPWGLGKYFKIKAFQIHKDLQKVNVSLEKCVGHELALAYFLIYRGGRIKFKGQDNWICLNKDKKLIDLPQTYDPNYIVLEIDATDIILHYHGLEHFRYSNMIKRAIFKRSLLFDDWYVDRISSYFPLLEYLDISDCPNVTERSLEALYKCSNLKTLVITDYINSASFQLMCLMLEDCLPELRIEILAPTKLQEFNENFNYIK